MAIYPNTDSKFEFKDGRNDFIYDVGNTLTIYPAEGYKLKCSDNFEYNITDSNIMAGMIKDNMTIASAQTVIKNGTATLSFPVRDLD